MLVIKSSSDENEICLRFKDSLICFRAESRDIASSWIKSIAKAADIPEPVTTPVPIIMNEMTDIDLSSPPSVLHHINLSDNIDNSKTEVKKNDSSWRIFARRVCQWFAWKKKNEDSEDNDEEYVRKTMKRKCSQSNTLASTCEDTNVDVCHSSSKRPSQLNFNTFSAPRVYSGSV